MDEAAAVSFDFGQTLASLDPEMLAQRAAERGVELLAARVEAAEGEAWRAYNEAILGGAGGHPWKILMRRLLEVAGADPARIEALVDWLWTEQPRRNLWRRPVRGMIELVRELRRAGVPVAVLSNSEGHLEELVAELGWSELFVAVADSGKLGFEKPGREIFVWTAERLGAPLDRVVHIGDSMQADVRGALGAGMRAVWFGGQPSEPLPAGAVHAADAAEVRAALGRWGL